jgi:hypothetical protein
MRKLLLGDIADDDSQVDEADDFFLNSDNDANADEADPSRSTDKADVDKEMTFIPDKNDDTVA